MLCVTVSMCSCGVCMCPPLPFPAQLIRTTNVTVAHWSSQSGWATVLQGLQMSPLSRPRVSTPHPIGAVSDSNTVAQVRSGVDCSQGACRGCLQRVLAEGVQWWAHVLVEFSGRQDTHVVSCSQRCASARLTGWDIPLTTSVHQLGVNIAPPPAHKAKHPLTAVATAAPREDST